MYSKTTIRLFLSVICCGILSACATDSGRNAVTPSVEPKPYKEGVVTPVGYVYDASETFSVLSWNVEHFVDSYDDPYINSTREDQSAEHMANKLAYFVEALKTANADIVVLQEFESAKFLREIASTHLTDMGYAYFADAPSHTWYMNVVVMSRFPLGIMYGFGNVTTPLPGWLDEQGNEESQSRINTRSWAIDVFPAQDYNLLLTALHLKAGRGERNESMRLGQIDFLRGQFDRFLAEDPDRNILIVGDLNATPDSLEIKTLLGDVSLSNGFIDPLGPNDLTHPANDLQRRLDYILYNLNMAPEVVPNSVKPIYFFDRDKQDDTADHLPVIGYFYRNDR